MYRFNFYSCFFIGLALLAMLPTAEAKPDKIRCIIRDEPATTMTIGWNQASGSNPILLYGTTDFGTDAEKYTMRASATRTVHAKGMHNHYVRLANLRPNTTYYFVIQDSDGTTKRYFFKTTPDDHNARLSVLAGGDSRNYRQARLNANKLVARLRADFVLFDGDMTGGDTDREWIEWLSDWEQTISPDGRITPVIPARGNHERSNQSIYDMFDTRNPDIYYAQTFARGLLRIYTLNSMMPSSGNQRDWLEQDLSSNQDVAWRIAQYHHPMRPHTTRKGEHEHLRRLWGAVFYKYGVRLAIECDSHVAKVTKALRSSNEPGSEEGFIEDEKGTYFVGEGGWGAPLREADDPKRWTTGLASINQINWIFIDLNKIEVRVVQTDNADQVQSVSDNNRFAMPQGIALWDFNPQSCLVIPNKIENFNPRETKVLTEMAQVSSQIDKEKVYLSWTATSEMPNARFKIQTSTNKIYWTTVGITAAKPAIQNQSNKYIYTDAITDKGGKYYYRISLVDSAGNERMKRDIEVRALGNERMDLLTASSSNGQLIVDIELPANEKVVFEILNINLKSVFIQEFPFSRGRHKVPLNVRYLQPGYYLLEISYGEQLIRKNLRITQPNAPEN
jgi:acid phosphatase type 7